MQSGHSVPLSCSDPTLSCNADTGSMQDHLFSFHGHHYPITPGIDSPLGSFPRFDCGNEGYVSTKDLSFRFYGPLNLQLARVVAAYNTLPDNFSG